MTIALFVMAALEIKVLDRTAAAALLDPARLEVYRALREGDSAASVARKLGLPRQRVNYHLRELETAGLVEAVGERRKGNCTERLLRPIARSFAISPAVLGDLGVAPAAECVVRFASGADRAAFLEDLAHELARLAKEYDDPAGRIAHRVSAYHACIA